jgi:predicted ATPase/DNA-binding SARP family transcriptional activator
VRFRVLGAVELVDERGHPWPVTSPNQRTVLAVLLACRGEVVTIDALVDALWGDSPPASAVATLRTYVSRLRGQLGDALASRGGGFALEVVAGELDAEHFESLVDAACQAGAEEAAGFLAAALELWKGPAFGDRSDVERVRAEACRLDERHRAAREAHADALLQAGRVNEAVAAAEALVTAEPLREGGWAVLIEALAGAHRYAEALRAFQRAGRVLAEVGLEPSARLRDAERIALSGDATRQRAPANTAPPPTAPRRFHPPIVPSSFIGRDVDIDLVVELLDDARIVTLTGPGGVGKTRLALEVARRATERRELGACVVELAPVDDPASVADVVVASLGLTPDGGPAAELLPKIGALDVLIVLDNAEHVIEGVAATVERILAGGPVARVLTTSRERVAVNGEHVWTVAPLASDRVEAPAPRLFRERASAVGTVPDDTAVMRIVQRLDGLPLAIEMAAAQLDTTTADELADALDEDVGGLRSPGRRVPARHRSLADVLAWSEARLDEREARTLAELSVFAGPVIASDIEGVLDEPGIADVVRALARRSLVSVDRSSTPARFHLLQTIRSFASDRLADSGRTDEMLRRHARWFVGVVSAADAQLRTAEEAPANSRLASTFAEVRAAYGWAAHHDLELAAELAARLHLYAQSRFIDEPLQWGELLLDRLDADHHPRRPVLLASAAWRALRRGDIAGARRLASEALTRAGDRPAAMPALDVLTDAGLFDGHVAESSVTARALRDLARRHGDLLYLAIGHSGVALSAVYGALANSDTQAEWSSLDELALPPSGRGWLAYTRGELCQPHDPHRALAHFGDALADARTVNNRYVEGAAIVSYCSLQARIGDTDEALDAFAEAIRHWLRAANTTQQLTTLRNLAVLFQRVEAAEALADLLGTVDRGDVPTYGDEADRLNDARAWAVTRLGTARFAELNTAGAARDMTTAATVALQVIDALRSSRRQLSSAPPTVEKHPITRRS